MKEQKDPLQEEKSTSWYKLTWYFLKTYIWETREALEVGERRKEVFISRVYYSSTVTDHITVT